MSVKRGPVIVYNRRWGGGRGGRGEEIEGFMLIQSKIYLSTISLCCIMKIKKDERVEKKIESFDEPFAE